MRLFLFAVVTGVLTFSGIAPGVASGAEDSAAPYHPGIAPATASADAVAQDLALILKQANHPAELIRFERIEKDSEAHQVHVQCSGEMEDDANLRVRLNVEASDAEWASAFYYGLQRLGYLFPHPRVQVSPAINQVRQACGKTFQWEPRFSFRGFQLHTAHPNEWVHGFLMGKHEIAESTVRWHARNGQNVIKLVVLRDSIQDLRRNLANPLFLAQDLGLRVGLGVSFVGIQQRSYRLIQGIFDNERWQVSQMRKSIREIQENLPFDFLGMEMGTSEFTASDYDKTLRWIEEARTELRRSGKWLFIKIHVSSNQYDEKYGNYNFLARFSHPEVGVLPHTVMFYGLLDDYAPVYGRKDLRDMREFLLQENEKRPVWYYPETSYWIAMDIDIPLFLTDYLTTRSRDMDFIEQHGVQGHLTFTSGHELGYWLMDWTVALLANGAHRGDPLAGLKLLGEDAELWRGILDYQTRYLKEGRLLELISSSNLLDELPFFSHLVHDRIILRKLRGQTEVIQGQLERLHRGITAFPDISRVGNRELQLMLYVTQMRLHHAYYIRLGLYYDRHPELKNAALDEAREARKLALGAMKEVIGTHDRYPEAMNFSRHKNPTSYSFGYGWTAAKLHFWEREERMVRERKYSPFFMNIYNFMKILF